MTSAKLEAAHQAIGFGEDGLDGSAALAALNPVMDASPMILAALADQPWQRVLFYEEGYETGGMHGVVAEARPQDGRLVVAMRNRMTLPGL